MFTINENYLKLQGSYLFFHSNKKVAAYKSMHRTKQSSVSGSEM